MSVRDEHVISYNTTLRSCLCMWLWLLQILKSIGACLCACVWERERCIMNTILKFWRCIYLILFCYFNVSQEFSFGFEMVTPDVLQVQWQLHWVQEQLVCSATAAFSGNWCTRQVLLQETVCGGCPCGSTTPARSQVRTIGQPNSHSTVFFQSFIIVSDEAVLMMMFRSHFIDLFCWYNLPGKEIVIVKSSHKQVSLLK